jgi:thiol peroxidase
LVEKDMNLWQGLLKPQEQESFAHSLFRGIGIHSLKTQEDETMEKAAKVGKEKGRKSSRTAKKANPKGVKAVSRLKKAIGGKRKIVPPAKARGKSKAAKQALPKDSLIQRLKRQLSGKDQILRESEKTLKETVAKVGKEVSTFKDKMSQTLSDWKSKAEGEIRNLRGELEGRTKALQEKAKEFGEYREKAEKRIADLQAKARTWVDQAISPGGEQTGKVTFKGNPVTLLGREVKVGDPAPQFQVVNPTMQPVSLASFKGKFKLISSVPSLDTPVCDRETKRFNEEAGKLPENVVVLTISMDLPFAQARWCAAAGVEKVKTLSDFQNRSFGLAYGVLIKELKLLARAVFIVDDQDVVRYVELVPEITQEPDYDRVLSAMRALL